MAAESFPYSFNFQNRCSQQCNNIHFCFVVVYLHHTHARCMFCFSRPPEMRRTADIFIFLLVKWLRISLLYVIFVLNATLPQFFKWNQMVVYGAWNDKYKSVWSHEIYKDLRIRFKYEQLSKTASDFKTPQTQYLV